MALWLSDDYAEFRREEAVSGGWFQRAARLLEELPPAPGARLAGGLRGARDARRGRCRGRAARSPGRRARSAASSAAVDVEMFAARDRGRGAASPRAAVEPGMRRLDEAAAAALGGEFDDLRAAGWTCCLLIGACERVRDFGRAAQWCAEAEAFSRRLDIRFVNGVCRAHYGAVLCWHGDWDGAERELTGALDELTEKRPAWRSRRGRPAGRAAAAPGPDRRGARAVRRGGARPARAARARGGRAGPRRRRVGARRRGRAAAAGGRGADGAGRRAGAARARVRRRRRRRRGGASTPAELRAIAGRRADRPGARGRELLRGPGGRRRGRPRNVRSPITSRRSRATRAARRRSRPLARGSGSPRRSPALGRTEAARREASAAAEALDAIGAATECGRAQGGGAAARHRGRGDLSAREVEVLRLVAEGLGDRQIAGRLTLSEHTVHRHVANIHAKLRCSSRAAAVALAHRRGLL